MKQIKFEKYAGEKFKLVIKDQVSNSWGSNCEVVEYFKTLKAAEERASYLIDKPSQYDLYNCELFVKEGRRWVLYSAGGNDPSTGGLMYRIKK